MIVCQGRGLWSRWTVKVGVPTHCVTAGQSSVSLHPAISAVHTSIIIESNIFLEINESKITRGHNYTLVKKQSRLDVRKYSFSQRTINVWNKLSTDCVHASSVNMFKNKIDKYLVKTGYPSLRAGFNEVLLQLWKSSGWCGTSGQGVTMTVSVITAGGSSSGILQVCNHWLLRRRWLADGDSQHYAASWPRRGITVHQSDRNRQV